MIRRSKDRKVITIDGFAGTGKSTISKLFAEKIQYVHLNTGLLYRAVAVHLKEAGVEDSTSENQEKIKQALKNVKLILDFDRDVDISLSTKTEKEVKKTREIKVYRNGKEFIADFYSRWISENSSKFSALPAVREFLMQSQREAFPGKNLVAEGRDVGTVVFPEANLKFFINVDVDIRAKRRLLQLQQESQPQELQLVENIQKPPPLEIILTEIKQRDERDTTRAISPTIPAKDAIFIDNSHKSLTDVLNEMYHHASLKGLV